MKEEKKQNNTNKPYNSLKKKSNNFKHITLNWLLNYYIHQPNKFINVNLEKKIVDHESFINSF